jgi:hypothetical protein
MAFTFETMVNQFSNKDNKKGKAGKAFSDAFDATKTASVKAVDTAKGYVPVTNRRFEDMVADTNSKLNNHDRDIWMNKFDIHVIAQAAGVNLESDEKKAEMYEELLKDEVARIKEEERKDEKPTSPSNPIADVLDDPELLSRIKAFLFGSEEQVENVMNQEAVKSEDIKAKVSSNKIVGKVRVEEPAVEEIEEVEESPVKEEGSKAKDNPSEWKSCVSCDADVSVVYKHDQCPHCRRTEKAKESGSQRPRLRFDDSAK